jgi:phosphomannomutase
MSSAKLNFLRASNTQPVLVMRFEADTEAYLQAIQTPVEAKLKELINQ